TQLSACSAASSAWRWNVIAITWYGVACADFSSLDVQYQKLNWGVPLSIQLLLESFTEGPNALRVFSPRPPKWFLPRERVEQLRKSGVFLLDLKSSSLSVAQRWFCGSFPGHRGLSRLEGQRPSHRVPPVTRGSTSVR
ncbi:hypothetical protein L218DRAFT_1079737, partial [Marasmius fiardii PR-910]